MKLKTNTNSTLVPTWEKRMLKAGHRFVSITTTRAIYYRAVVVVNNPTSLVINYPMGTSKKKNFNTANCGNDTFTIKQETIMKEDIVNIRYYKED